MANATLRYRQAQYKSCPLDMYLITPESAVNVFTIVKKLLFVNSTTQLSWKIYLNGICHQPNFGIIFMPEILYKLRDN